MTAEAMQSVTIDAPITEVEKLLRETLSDVEREAMRVTAYPQEADPLAPERQGEMEVARVVIEFLGSAAASGIAFEAMKKVATAAIAKFGRKNVK